MTDPCPRRLSHSVLQSRFLSILPTIRSVARFYFRDRPARYRADYIAETVAYAWASFVRLARRGKDARLFATKFAQFNAKAVRNGRRVAGGFNRYDLTSVPAEESGSRLECLHAPGRNSWEEVLVDARGFSPADAAAIRIDFAAWLKTLSRRNRRIADALATGERTSVVAKRFKLTPGRISQLRREFAASWRTFTQDDTHPDGGSVPAAA